MAIEHHATTISALDWIVSGARSFTVDVGSGDDRVLCVLAFLDRSSSTTIDGATYDGVTMSAESAVLGPTGLDTRLFYLPAPATDSNTLVVTCSNDSAKVGVIASIYTGAHQSSPLGSITARSSSVLAGNSFSGSQTTAAGDTAVLMLYSSDTSGNTAFYAPYGAMTERLDNYGFVADIAADATSMTVGFTPQGSMGFGGYSFALSPSGVAAGVPKTTKQTLMGAG